MKYFDRPITVILPSSVIDKARQFANDVVKTVDYSDSNQVDQRKISLDHFISKIGEEAVKHLLINRNALVEGPDYNIYEAAKKSWSSDLIVDEIHLAVKTQTRTAAEKYGLSWTFQCSEVRRDIILDKPEAWVCFVECDDTNAYQCTVFPPVQIKRLTFRPPKLSQLTGKKKVVYANDLKKLF